MSRVLLVDDEVDIVEGLGILLEMEGFTGATARDGLEALRAAELEPPDVIVTDLMMPVMTGLELMRELKQRPALQDVPIVVISAALGPAMALPDAAHAFRKPLDFDALVVLLRRLTSTE